MNKSPDKKTPQALTDKQIVDRLAVEVMGWKKKYSPRLELHTWVWQKREDEHREFHRDFYSAKKNWNPMDDWNHWRQVEEKVMENWELLTAYLSCLYEQSDKKLHLEYLTVKATLPTHCNALLLALDSLHSNE